MRQNYHVEIPSPQQQQQQQQQPQQQQSSQNQHMKVDSKSNAQVYHITLDQPQQQQISQQQQQQQQQHKSHSQNQQPPQDRGYHLEIKHDDRKDARIVQQQQPSSHISEGIVYTSMRPGMPPIHSTVMTLPPNQQGVINLFFFNFDYMFLIDICLQNAKPGGSITQGYPNRAAGSQGPPPPQASQMHYQRHRY